MKLIKCTNLLVIGLALSIVTGCHGKRYNKVTNIPNPRTGTPSGDDQSGKLGSNAGIDTTTTSFPLPGPGRHDGWPKNHELLKAETVYFAFDSSEIKSDQKSKIQSVADYLRKEGVDVEVEGHCDERGTEEYNRALGSRRALAIREQLIALGITPDRVEVISFGEDRPAMEGNNEAAWSKNRRGMFVVLTPPK